MRISDWSSDVCSSDLHAERAVEVEDVGADRLAGGVGEADAREAEGVLERPVHQHPPERVEQPVAKGDRPAVENARAATPRHVHEEAKQLALAPAGILPRSD